MTSRRSASAVLVSLSLVASLPAGADADSGECAAEGVPALAAVATAVESAAVFTQAPGIEAFAREWTRSFAGCVRSAAGTDGRLSLSEATRLGDRTDRCALFSDNARNWLSASEQQSVDVDKLIRSGYSYAFATGKKAAGQDGRISLADAAAKLPEDLRADYLDLRGRLPSTGPDLAALAAAAEGLIYSSEGDAYFVVLAPSAEPVSGAITAEKVRAAFAAEHDLAARDGRLWGSPDEDYMALADRVPESRDFGTWFSRLEEPLSDHPASVAEAARFTTLRETLEAQLTDLTVYRFGERSSDEGDVITASTFLVGRAADGRLVAILTGAVET